jgi:hypothetical protein
MGAAIDAIRHRLRTTGLDGAGWENGTLNDDESTNTVHIKLYQAQGVPSRWVKLGEFECDDRYLPLVEQYEEVKV